MKKIPFLILLILTTSRLFSQGIEDLTFGTDTTLEVMTWNIEWFPKNGQTTVDYITQIIQALDVDLLALQEIDDKGFFDQMVDNLDGWETFYVNDPYSGLAYIYKPDQIEVGDVFEIYTNKFREFPRPPLVMEMQYRGEDFIVINNHLKCCGDGILDPSDPWDEESRRFDACNLLDQYIQTNYPDNNVILLGDLNDVLTDDPVDNVFRVFTTDEENYQFADMVIAEGNSYGWSYPWWPSHIDHILITNELFDEFEDESAEIRTIVIDDYLEGGLIEYDDNVSDHRPVALKLTAGSDNYGIYDVAFRKTDFKNHPNPFINATTLSFDPVAENTTIEIYNTRGQKIQSFNLHKGQSSIVWDAEKFSPGIYITNLVVDNQIVAVSKMVFTP